MWRELVRDCFLQEGPQLLEEETCGQEEGGCNSDTLPREISLVLCAKYNGAIYL